GLLWPRFVAYAPDGRSVATARNDGRIGLWDLRSGKQLPFGGVPGVEAHCLAFSRDARLLASGHADGTVLVWDLQPAAARPRGKPDAAQLEQWWADLAGADARRAYAAVRGLADDPPPTLRLFRGRLRPAAEAPPDQVRRLIGDLDSSEFQR